MGWAALSELVPLYPLYALLFLDTGLSEAQLSLLFATWSLTALVTEVPAGLLADRWSRRGSLVLGGCLQAAAFALWTALPSFAVFLAGFVIWGIAGACTSGAAEALVHDGLAEVDAAESYARVNGAMTAAELLVQVPTALAATGLHALGDYRLVGWVSVLACLAAAALALRLPEPRPDGDPEEEGSRYTGLVLAVRRPILLTAAYGIYLAVLVAAEAELQRRISGPYRATITSVAGPASSWRRCWSSSPGPPAGGRRWPSWCWPSSPRWPSGCATGGDRWGVGQERPERRVTRAANTPAE
ncbi:MFS transporter [Blastococcus sp. HT6-30]|uniref:MFS transporter n=1 Tax=Blastococcus sp. HT6-30 TaxID=3144843 RepID=UPI00321A5CB8